MTTPGVDAWTQDPMPLAVTQDLLQGQASPSWPPRYVLGPSGMEFMGVKSG